MQSSNRASTVEYGVEYEGPIFHNPPSILIVDDTPKNLSVLSQMLLTHENYNTHLAIVFALAKLAESRDDEMGKHLERVRTFCHLLTVRLRRHPRYKNEIDDEFTENIYNASLLHDIGKVAIPDQILIKKGKLTEEEFGVMKSHADHGARTLEAVRLKYPKSALLNMGIEISRHHHEKWDGSGYPMGLEKESIPLSARIMAVADVYDALRSARCYKPAFSHKVSSEMILQESGSHFDPEVVGAFAEIQDHFKESREQMAS